MYSTKSQTTKMVCKQIGFRFDIKFVETMRRGDKIYVRGTCGKPHEFDALEAACQQYGYIFRG